MGGWVTCFELFSFSGYAEACLDFCLQERIEDTAL